MLAERDQQPVVVLECPVHVASASAARSSPAVIACAIRLEIRPARTILVERGHALAHEVMGAARAGAQSIVAAQIHRLCRDDELDRRETRQARDDIAGLLDDARRHRRIVLGAVRDRRRHRPEREREMTDLRLERGRGLLHSGKPGAAAAMPRQEPRQVREAGRHQLGDAEHRDRGGVRQRKPQPLERERQRGGVEIHRGEHLAIVGEHRRAVAGAVEVGVDRRVGARQLIERGAHHRSEAAERERVLHAARILRVHQIAAGEQPQQALRRFRLSGRGTQRGDARIERREIGAERLERQRAGGDQRLERERRIVMASAPRCRR